MLLLLMIVQDVNLIECALQVLLIKQLLIGCNIGHLHEVLHHIVVYLSRRMSHIDSALEFSLGEKVGKTRAMIYMKMRHEDQVHILGVDNIEVWQSLHSLFAGMNATVHKYFATFALNVDAGATDLIT